MQHREATSGRNNGARKGLRRTIQVLFALALCVTCVRTDELWGSNRELTDKEVVFVQATISRMKQNARGPYRRLRWFCNDGTIQPPGGSCRERGGGFQHGEFSDEAKALQELGIHVGTILRALDYESFFDAEDDNYRLKEYVLENYLIDTDDGWVLRRARYYRGARQIEDEQRQGQAFLEKMLADPVWTIKNYQLANLLVSIIPSSNSPGQTTARTRNLAQEIAEVDPAFMPIRIKIHSFPSRGDIEAVNSYIESKSHDEPVRDKLDELLQALEVQYDKSRILEEIRRFGRGAGSDLSEELTTLQRALEGSSPWESIFAIARVGSLIREVIASSSDGSRNLRLLSLNSLLSDQAFVLAQEAVHRGGGTRRERLEHLTHLFALARALGLLSDRENQALDSELADLLPLRSIPSFEYKRSLTYLSRSLDWARGTTRQTFGPVLAKYMQFESVADSFLDASVRGTIVLPLSMLLDELNRDVDRAVGASHDILGKEVSQGVRGLNSGVARGRLKVLREYRHDWKPDATGIYVIPETIPKLDPVAGVLTLDAGNLLSHVQLLARGLGIPNASISSSLLPILSRFEDREVFYAVSPLGIVVLKVPENLGDVHRTLLERSAEGSNSRLTLDRSRLRFDRQSPIRLDDLRASDSGEIVGPKAGNLGRLRRLFPGAVADGIALPFGMYARHIEQAWGPDGRPLSEQIREAFDAAALMQAEGRPESEVKRFIFGHLELFRAAIVELPWLPEMRDQITDAIRATFGSDLSDGVFVRSDTNVEDLPEFSGAGLNLTVPHRRTLSGLLESIRQVWASPFSERAYLWRSQALDNLADVYPSVLLLASVPSEKSGVMITSGLDLGSNEDLTVVVGEGVGGAVEGEDTETLLIRKSGGVKLLSQSKSSERRVLNTEGVGGVSTVPARREEYLLTSGEIQSLWSAAGELKAKIGADEAERIWDIEFGFVSGKLWLFQIRPFVVQTDSELAEALRALDRTVLAGADTEVPLDEPPS